ncbi:MAG: SDR family oxidoreductase [Ramlibacter sp.]
MDGQGSLEGRVAIVTGGAGDIGVAIATHYRQAGARVALLDCDAQALRRAADNHFASGDDALLTIECDVADPQASRDAVQSVIERWQGLHVLVNNAAAETPSSPIGDARIEDVRRALDVNVVGAWLMSKWSIPQMAAAGGGVVLNIASQIAHVAVAGRGAYGVSKAALLALTRAIAVDHAKQGIRSVSLSPGAVMTRRLTDRYGTPAQVTETLAPRYPAGRIGTADEVARVALFLAGDGAAFVTGTDWLVDGGYTAQ